VPVQTGPLAIAEVADVRARTDTRTADRAEAAAIDLFNFTAGLFLDQERLSAHVEGRTRA
jgi:hypothetical protein